jgi:hypothetical protein
VSGKAQIFGQAWVYENAEVAGTTMIDGTARVTQSPTPAKVEE